MEPNTLTISYVVEVTGDQQSHEELRETVDELEGAEVVVAHDKEGYFEVQADE